MGARDFRIALKTRHDIEYQDPVFAVDEHMDGLYDQAKIIAHRYNSKQKELGNELFLSAAKLNASGILHLLYQTVISQYLIEQDHDFFTRLTPQITRNHSCQDVLVFFAREFPSPVLNALQPTAPYLMEETTRGFFVHQVIMDNPALVKAVKPLVKPEGVRFPPASLALAALMGGFTRSAPGIGENDDDLFSFLTSPAKAHPESLIAQISYILREWKELLPERLRTYLLRAIDFVQEEEKPRFHGGGPGIVAVPSYDSKDMEYEAYSMDRNWMPNVIMLAKSTLVWLDQLSRMYGYPIETLDQIPDHELDLMAQRGFSGLWLIGLWERSDASKRIKNLCGNPEAEASAYSLKGYDIATSIGGWTALRNLDERCKARGIRLASDMVPNHTGLDSDWALHHPEYFIRTSHPPFPSYTYNGEDLSPDPRIEVKIEDHYFDRTDAAVTYRRIDRETHETSYIFHGNDGTSMPWNDTAQLDFLNPNTREAVIQQILHVARNFHIIRFDAAMTLAKRHVQRLWYPQPGSGGDIPGRAGAGMSDDEFAQRMPNEFWREVVDRVAAEVPDTLLLAEAFWMMEGYFVRTLGMHRVYNSAFMNMLRNEDNVGYRKLIRNTLEFEPEILKRYVNFMNNPDERTAVDQFGKGDKYFGICILMATLPGLPMLGHGQIEGFAEKYGMEFRKAYWDEKVDPDLVSRHEWEIFPLLHERRLFAGVEHFNLYDFVTNNGSVNENVYAYSNHENGSSALVIYNNNIHETEGWIRDSIPQLRKHGNDKQIESFPLGRALFLPADRAAYVIFRDQVTRLQYLRPLSELLDRGLHIKLRGYQYHAFLDFRVVHSDPSYDYRSLYGFIGEQGVPDIEQALCELVLRPVQDPYRALINPDYLGYLLQKYSGVRKIETMDEGEIDHKVENILRALKDQTQSPREIEELRKRITSLFINGLTLEDQLSKITIPGSKKVKELVSFLLTPLEAAPLKRYTLLTWALCSQFGQLNQAGEFKEFSNAWLDEFQLAKPLAETLREAGMQEEQIQEQLLLLRLGISQQDWYDLARKQPFEILVKSWLAEPEIQAYLRVNRYQGILWYNHEAFESFTWWMSLIAVVSELTNSSGGRTSTIETILNLFEIITSLKKIESRSEYKFEKLADLIR